MGGGGRRLVADEHNLQNTITLQNDGIKAQWRKDIAYRCSTDRCNSPSTLKRLLRSLRSVDTFSDLSNLLAMNPEFSGGLCSFFANNSTPCESDTLDVCLNCLLDDVTENFVTRGVKFFMNNRECHDIWMIECQQKDCNTAETGNLIEEKSTIGI